MMKNTITTVLLGAVVLAGCGKQGESGASASGPTENGEQGTPLVTFADGGKISAETFKSRLMKQSPFLRARYSELDKKKEFLDSMIRFELLAREAKRRGLENDPDVEEVVKKVMVQKLVKQLEETQQANISEEELKAYYDAHIDDYQKPERVRISHVFVATESGDDRGRAAARKKAAGILEEVRQKPDDPRWFQEVARSKSDDASSRAVGGDLRYVSREELATAWGEAVAEAALALDPVGTVSEVVEGDKGYHVLKLSGRTKALDRTFDQVRKQIEMRVAREKRTESFDDFVTALKAKESVAIDEELLAVIEVTGSGVSMPGDKPAIPAPSPPGLGAPAAPPAGEEDGE